MTTVKPNKSSKCIRIGFLITYLESVKKEFPLINDESLIECDHDFYFDLDAESLDSIKLKIKKN